MKIVQAGGQTCNQFWIYSNYIADCLERNESFSILVPDNSFVYYPNLLKSEFILLPLFSLRLSKICGVKNYLKILNLLLCNKYSLTFLKSVLNILPAVSFTVPDVHCPKSKFRVKHLHKLRSIFTPRQDIVSDVELTFEPIRRRYNVIVGVHIRYGDYRTFSGGRYFYKLEEYKSLVEKMISLFPESKIAFFVASNENIALSFFSNIDCFSLPNSSSIKDLYALGLCDYILGAPSTFSAWASLCGDVPLYFVENLNNDFDLDSFKRIQSTWLNHG
jgi:hypothetical protein